MARIPPAPGTANECSGPFPLPPGKGLNKHLINRLQKMMVIYIKLTWSRSSKSFALGKWLLVDLRSCMLQTHSVHYREISFEISRQPFRVSHPEICPRTPFVSTSQSRNERYQKGSNSEGRRRHVSRCSAMFIDAASRRCYGDEGWRWVAARWNVAGNVVSTWAGWGWHGQRGERIKGHTARFKAVK